MEDKEPEAQSDLVKRIEDMEASISEWRRTSNTDAEKETMAVFGGLGTLGDEWDAAKLIKDKLWELWGPQPTKVFSK